MTKGEMMKKIYTEKELQNIDSAIPISYWEKVNPHLYVMNYNDNGAFGKLESLLQVAEERDINLN